MISAILAVMVVYIMVFQWFPKDDWLPWVMFLLSFLVCFAISLAVMTFKEHSENKRMEEALEKMKRLNQMQEENRGKEENDGIRN